MTQAHAPLGTPASVDDPLMIDLSVFPAEISGTAILSHNGLGGRWKWSKDYVQLIPLANAKLTEVTNLYKDLRPANDPLLEFIKEKPDLLKEIFGDKSWCDLFFLGTIRVRQPWVHCVRVLHRNDNGTIAPEVRSLDKAPHDHSYVLLLR